MSHMFTPQHPFECPGCDQSIPRGWKPGIGFDDDGVLLCADCLDDIEPSTAGRIVWHDHHVGIEEKPCKDCNLYHPAGDEC